MTCKTGIAKLDRLLGGGVRSGNRVLLYGPSFQGKETLARTIFLAALSRGEAAVMILRIDDVIAAKAFSPPPGGDGGMGGMGDMDF